VHNCVAVFQPPAIAAKSCFKAAEKKEDKMGYKSINGLI